MALCASIKSISKSAASSIAKQFAQTDLVLNKDAPFAASPVQGEADSRCQNFVYVLGLIVWLRTCATRSQDGSLVSGVSREGNAQEELTFLESHDGLSFV